MQDESHNSPDANESDSHVKQVMGPSIEESKPVSVPNESAVELPETGEVIAPKQVGEPDSRKEDQNPETTPTDSEVQEAFEAPIGWREKLKHSWRRYWRIPHIKLYTFGALAGLLLAVGLIPVSRYFVLNMLGVRCSTSIALYDETTRQPLKNVIVSARGVSQTTGSDGKVKLEHLKLGRTRLSVKRRAFAEVNRTVTLGWGSNPQGNLELKPTGDQYMFQVNDWLSNTALEGAEATSGDLAALSDKTGKILLAVDAGQGGNLQVTIRAEGYRFEQLNLNNSTTAGVTAVKMVSSRKQPFITKQSGKFDLYKIDVDGKNEERVLAGTGNEQPGIGLAPHPTDDVMAMVSTRDNLRNQDGFLLSTLTFVDLNDNTTRTLTHSERLQIVGWVGSRLIYVQITQGASAANAARQKLLSYDYKAQKTDQLASSNSFNDVVMIGRSIYYAPSNAYTPEAPAAFYKISADGSNRQTVLDKEVWNIFRTDYSSLQLSVQQEWYELQLAGNAKPTKQKGAPGDLTNRIYNDSPDGTRSLWVEERDGKGTLLLYDVGKKTEKSIKDQAGLSGPVRWLDNRTLIYRIHSLQETADYVLNIEGGDAKKIRDVTHTESLGRWYYY